MEKENVKFKVEVVLEFSVLRFHILGKLSQKDGNVRKG